VTTILPTGQVEFRFFRPNASEVCVVGSFNHWRVGLTPMQGDGKGWWQAILELPFGAYEFRYVADAQWYTDFAANGIEHGKFGWNSVLLVGPPRAVAA